MSGIWSKNKYINVILNVLLFLLSINLLHYGQFILPIMCLILFVDNKFKFKANKWSTFIILCLFAISFFAFSFRYDAVYSVMAFCLPMAYYIGSNVKNINEDNIKKIIYILAFGMAFHVLLNFAYDFYYDGLGIFTSNIHRDIWLGNVKTKQTATGVLYVFILGCAFNLFVYEKNKFFKYAGISLLAIIMIYDIGLGRRTPILMLCVSIAVSVFYSLLVNKKLLNKLKPTFLATVIVFVMFTLLIYFNIFGLKDILNNTIIIKKFLWVGLDPERLDIFLAAFKEMPNHLWGQREIFEVSNVEVHDLWMDIYDWGGIVPFVLFIVYTVISAIELFKNIKNRNISIENKTLIITISVCIFAQSLLEPIISGSSLFLICIVLYFTLIEKCNLQYNSKQ